MLFVAFIFYAGLGMFSLRSGWQTWLYGGVPYALYLGLVFAGAAPAPAGAGAGGGGLGGAAGRGYGLAGHAGQAGLAGVWAAAGPALGHLPPGRARRARPSAGAARCWAG